MSKSATTPQREPDPDLFSVARAAEPEAAPVNAPHAAPKVDPETLVIRASPLRAIRFKRKVVVGITTVGVIALVGVTGIALKPSVFKVIANGDDKTDLGARAPADALSALPKTYGDVPRLRASFAYRPGSRERAVTFQECRQHGRNEIGYRCLTSIGARI